MNRLRAFVVFSVVIGIVCVFGGVAGAGFDPQPTGKGDGTLTIGQLAPETGSLSNISSSLTTPVTMAMDEINAAGGVFGNPVSYSVANDNNEPDFALGSLEVLLESGKVDAVMGPASSGTMLGILDDVRRAHVLVCSGSNTSSDLSTADSGGYYFRTAPSDRLQGPALAKLVLKDHHKRIAILDRSNTENRLALGQPLRKTLSRGGAKIVADVAFDPDATSFNTYVEEVASKKPDAVVVLGDQTDNDVVKAMIDNGLGPQQVPIYVPDAMRTDSFASSVDPGNPGAVAGIKGTSPAATPAGVHNPFPNRFAATGVPPIFSAYYYDCTILTALAAEKAKSDDPAKMKDVFASNTRGRNKCNSYANCKALLDKGKTIEYQGASAVFPHMNKFGKFEPNAGTYEIWAFDNTGRDDVQPTDSQIRIG
ncbi:MAG TPA: ABC transporter substrate-binding protein [Acidimicrobiia bacterium]|nr:ABC transporter substrate-binding protein [Acidimicrobiia bacterium]